MQFQLKQRVRFNTDLLPVQPAACSAAAEPRASAQAAAGPPQIADLEPAKKQTLSV